MTRFQRLCTAWFAPGTEVHAAPLASTGFSGSRLLTVRCPTGRRFVLKSFTSATPATRAAAIHALMRRLRAGGARTVPEVAGTRAGSAAGVDVVDETLARDDEGTLWELVEFVPGAFRQAPSVSEAAAAVAGLARLHALAADFPDDRPRREASPGIARRIGQARRMLADPWRRLAPPAAGPPLADEVRTALDRAVAIVETRPGREAVERVAATPPVPLVVQTVLRDVWSEHVLFADDGSLAGFIDFHAAGRDTPATDLARLLGSWGDEATPEVHSFTDRWGHAFDAYDSIRPLPGPQRRLVGWLHATGVLCGLDNWFRWLITEGRRFDDMSRVGARIGLLLRRLPAAVEAARDPFPARD